MAAYPMDVPPYQVQPLVTNVMQSISRSAGQPAHVTCAQALGSEIYVGCSNGELARFALQATSSGSPELYTLLSQQSLPGNKAIDSLVLIPSISRILVQCDHQIHFYTLPTLDPIHPQLVKPLRNIITFAVDELHLRRPPPSTSDPRQTSEPVDFCVIKRGAKGYAVVMYSIRERLSLQKDFPFQQGATFARRAGRFLCAADKENYNMVDLEQQSFFPILPLSQAPSSDVVIKPSITVIGENEFLLLSWTGENTLGVFITGEGMPVRGTLEWPIYPEAVCLDFPYLVTLLPDGTIQIHSIETQTLTQIIQAPQTTSELLLPEDRRKLAWSPAGFLVPSSQRFNKLRPSPVKLVRSVARVPAPPEPMEGEEIS